MQNPVAAVPKSMATTVEGGRGFDMTTIKL